MIPSLSWKIFCAGYDAGRDEDTDLVTATVKPSCKRVKTPIYEERRKVGISEQKALYLESKMRDLAEHVPNPPGISSIKNK